MRHSRGDFLPTTGKILNNESPWHFQFLSNRLRLHFKGPNPARPSPWSGPDLVEEPGSHGPLSGHPDRAASSNPLVLYIIPPCTPQTLPLLTQNTYLMPAITLLPAGRSFMWNVRWWIWALNTRNTVKWKHWFLQMGSTDFSRKCCACQPDVRVGSLGTKLQEDSSMSAISDSCMNSQVIFFSWTFFCYLALFPTH